MYDVSALERMS